MPYYRCPECGLATHGVRGRFTRNICPNCSVPLTGGDQVHIREHRPAAVTRRFRAEPQAAPAARRVLETLLWNLEDAEFQVLALLTTELIANGVEHAGTGAGGVLRLDVVVADDLVRVEVRDQGSGFVPAARTPESPLDSHWGLHLVDQLADRWEVAATPHTAVCFELDRALSATVDTRLTEALLEQARLGEAYECSAGTSSEFGSYMRLRAASRQVASCHRDAQVSQPQTEVDPGRS